jgi:hypothetical protein
MMIAIQLWIQKPEDVTTLPPQGNLAPRFRTEGVVMQKRLHTCITAEGVTMDT